MFCGQRSGGLEAWTRFGEPFGGSSSEALREPWEVGLEIPQQHNPKTTLAGIRIAWRVIKTLIPGPFPLEADPEGALHLHG